jgi:UDP-2,4-diacetamido-2,4,6-trideoxy-beta-L-altropyranose hydrolase
MNVAIRADASIRIGSGHIMRCLTLADALTARGAVCHFISRQCAGDLFDLIRQRGYSVEGLPDATSAELGVDWTVDAAQTRAAIETSCPTWLVVDHYQLDEAWESELKASVPRILAIDDIGRAHDCDALLDQNLANPLHARYQMSVAAGARLLLGPQFALVRPEFAALRQSALRRRDGSLSRLLVSMGGSDLQNATGEVLMGLLACPNAQWAIDVVIGSGNPHRALLEEACGKLPNTMLYVQTAAMAELMLAADCAIGAGGSTTWERCCLGLPALVAVASDDQVFIAEAVANAGAQIVLGRDVELVAGDYAEALAQLTPDQLRGMSASAAVICDGLGSDRVAEKILS